MPSCCKKLRGTKEILNSTCDLLDMQKLIEMFTFNIKVTVLDNTGDFSQICVSFCESVYLPVVLVLIPSQGNTKLKMCNMVPWRLVI